MTLDQSDRAAARDVALGFLAQKLDDSAFDVLPLVPEVWVHDAFARHAAQDRLLSLREKIVPISWIPTMVLHAVVTPLALQRARDRGLKVVARIAPENYRAAVRRHLGEDLRRRATLGLMQFRPSWSAGQRLSTGQQTAAALLLLAAAGLIALFGGKAVESQVLAASSLFFALVVAIRIFCLLPSAFGRTLRPPSLPDGALPVYTVMVPLFRETAVLAQLVAALDALDYPPDRLDIKLILEESDSAMQHAVARLALPPHFDILVVPSGQPQTKPRALNYGLEFARGELLTIYDAEDIPEPRQLRLAAEAFAAGERSVACLQAALAFYNPGENWLTRQFAAEYGALFRVMLPAFGQHRLPILLGGTSNHFRMQALRACGGWDAFNVTEDADLGLRLARQGYQTDVLASTTLEEANPALGNWLRQRRRWLKGFLQTWLVHMRDPIGLHRDLGAAGFWTVQCMTLGVFGSALLHPVLALHAILGLMPGSLALTSQTIGGQVFSGVALALLAGGYGVSMALSAAGLARIRQKRRLTTIMTLPAYWLLQSLAAWLALWDFLVRPFHWHKTTHGLSRHFRKAR